MLKRLVSLPGGMTTAIVASLPLVAASLSCSSASGEQQDPVATDLPKAAPGPQPDYGPLVQSNDAPPPISGGTLTVDAVGEGEATGFRIVAAGLNARIPQHVPLLLEGSSESGAVDAHAIQPFYTGLLARACGVGVGLVSEADTIVIATR